MQMSVLMGLFSSWNVDVVIKDEQKSVDKSFSKRFARTRGIWKDYDIDAKQLRRDAVFVIMNQFPVAVADDR